MRASQPGTGTGSRVTWWSWAKPCRTSRSKPGAASFKVKNSGRRASITTSTRSLPRSTMSARSADAVRAGSTAASARTAERVLSMRREAVYFVAPVRHTKIVTTIGPASRNPKVLQLLVQAGIDVVRLNFSHGEHADHLAVLRMVREIASSVGRPVSVLQDLSGPKIRTGKTKGGQPILLEDGASITITTDETVEGRRDSSPPPTTRCP
jgi:hypothetical protein